ncbi:MAG: nicotinate (nicotinamide) nucleotide adenylyltransferase [Phycisphaerales bacterium]|nr:nicotinate (nicotinamide) nucleotide adenylyltransferase [Phycisphaerales bacterium]
MNERAGVLLFGGSFNPVHHGHLIVCREVAERLNVRAAILIPSRTPPHKERVGLAPIEDRLEMCRLATYDDPMLTVSDYEARQSGPNFTLLTVQAFQRELKERLYWLIGTDSLAELHTWYHVGELADACTLVTAARAGYVEDTAHLRDTLRPEQIEHIRAHILPSPRIDISATGIRQRIEAGQSVRWLTPRAVEAYVRERGLYSA